MEYMMDIPAGNLLHSYEKIAHGNSWFTELKDGDFPVRKLLVCQAG